MSWSMDLDYYAILGSTLWKLIFFNIGSNMKKYSYFLIFLATTLIISCASTIQKVPLPNPNRISSSTKSIIYVIRPHYFGSAISAWVRDNFDVIGKLGPGGFLVWEREPGIANISTNTDNLKIEVQGGKKYYILLTMPLQVYLATPRFDLELIDESKAKDLIKKIN